VRSQYKGHRQGHYKVSVISLCNLCIMMFNTKNVCLSATLDTSCADQIELECVKRRSASNCRGI
jgi:hypothetical protein